MTIEEAAALLGSFKVGDRVTVIRRDPGREDLVRDGEVRFALTRRGDRLVKHDTITVAGHTKGFGTYPLGFITSVSVWAVAEGYVEVRLKRAPFSMQIGGLP